MNFIKACRHRIFIEQLCAVDRRVFVLSWITIHQVVLIGDLIMNECYPSIGMNINLDDSSMMRKPAINTYLLNISFLFHSCRLKIREQRQTINIVAITMFNCVCVFWLMKMILLKFNWILIIERSMKISCLSLNVSLDKNCGCCWFSRWIMTKIRFVTWLEQHLTRKIKKELCQE
jgi:hypothetical protein